MSEGIWIAIIGGIVTIAGGAFVLIRALRNSKTTEQVNAAAAAQAAFAANIALNKYIDEKVEAALKEPLAQIATLEQRVELLTTRERTTKDILRRWVQRLLWWDERGRRGEMPMPSPADMATLDLSDIETDTKTRAEVDAILDHSNPEGESPT